MIDVSIIIVSFNAAPDLERCLATLHQAPPHADHDIVVIPVGIVVQIQAVADEDRTAGFDAESVDGHLEDGGVGLGDPGDGGIDDRVNLDAVSRPHLAEPHRDQFLFGGAIRVADESELHKRIYTSDVDEVMPPPSTKNPLVPAALDAVVMKALNKDRFRRYTSALEFGRPFTTPG